MGGGLQIASEADFDTLRRSSERLNLRLREIAERLAESDVRPRTEHHEPQGPN